MSNDQVPIVPFATGAGQSAWLIRGPHCALSHDDIWQAIVAGLSHDPQAPRIRSATCTLTGDDLLAGTVSFETMPAGAWIGVHVARSAAMVQAVLGVWSRGSTYVPLPTDLPMTRLCSMIDGCRPDAIITDTQAFAHPHYQQVAVHDVAGRTLRFLKRLPDEAPAPARDGTRACYVAHTSGSTGAPKAVRVPHRALINRLTAMRRLVVPGPQDKVLFKTSLAFDVHLWEFVFPLVSGCMMIVYDQGPFFDLRNVARLIDDEGVTIAGFVPSLLAALLDRPEFGVRTRLRVMFCGGETWTASLARRFHERLPACALRNSYGPAETTLAVANWLVPQHPAPTRIQLGEPLENTIFVVDETSVEQGVVVGMLSIGGASVALGYVSTPADDPFVEHTIDDEPVRFYRTGDLVELHVETGAVLFRGRADRQVKLNGVRIELGEVEAAIQSLEEVEACAVVLLARSGTPCLLATYKTVTNLFLDPSRVRRRCSELLPSTHVPAYFKEVEAYELNASGKIDRARIEDVIRT